MKKLLAALGALALAAVTVPAAALEPLRADGTAVPVTPQRLAAVPVPVPVQTIEGTAHGHSSRLLARPLAEVLSVLGVSPVSRLRGAQLDDLVMVSAGDGYPAVFALAELDATLGASKVGLPPRFAYPPTRRQAAQRSGRSAPR